MALERALGIALAGMGDQRQVLEWAMGCDWSDQHGATTAFILAESAREEFVEKALQGAIGTIGEDDGRIGAILMAAAVAAHIRGSTDLAGRLMDECISNLRQHDNPSTPLLGRIRTQVAWCLSHPEDQRWMPDALDRLAAIAGALQGGAISKAIVKECIEGSSRGDFSSKKLAAVARILLKNNVCMDEEVVSTLQRTRWRKIGRTGGSACWPGTWIAIAHAMDARAQGEGHAATHACEVAISHILHDGRAVQPNLQKLAAGLWGAQSLRLVIEATHPCEWSPGMVETVMKQYLAAGEGARDEALRITLKALTGGSDEAWNACLMQGGPALLEAWLGQHEASGRAAGPRGLKIEPQEARCGQRLGAIFAKHDAIVVAERLLASVEMNKALQSWNSQLLQAAVGAGQIHAQAPLAQASASARPRM